MSISSEDAMGLKKVLEFDDLQKQYLDLQQSLLEITEKNNTLVLESEKTKAELETHKTLRAATELEKKEIDDKLQELIHNETRLREMNVQCLEEVQEKRDKIQKVENEVSQLRLNMTSKLCEIERYKGDLLKLTDTEHSLKRQLSFATEEKARVDKRLLELQESYADYRSVNISQVMKLEATIDLLKQEKEEICSNLELLQLAKDRTERELSDMQHQLSRALEEKDQMKIRLAATSKSFKELAELHEEYVKTNLEKVSTAEANIASIAGERDALKLKNTQLEASLKQEQELRREHFEKLTGAVTSSSDTQSASRLLNLMRDYEKLNRHPADIYEDFFELKAKYQNAVATSTQASNTVDTMTRKLYESENLFNRLNREFKESKVKVGTLETNLKREKEENKALQEENKQLKTNVNDLEEERLGLKASLKDTTYQLQYLLSDVQRRNEPIPANLRESAELLRSAQVAPNLPHDQLVYKNVAELQDLNTKLSYELRGLTQKLQQTTIELDLANGNNTTSTVAYSTALDKAKQTITDLSKKTADLQNQLDAVTVECTSYKDMIDQLGDGDARERYEGMQQTQLRQRDESEVSFKAYVEETNAEIAKLSNELETARAATVEARNNCSRLSAEIEEAKRSQANLKETIQELRFEKKNAKQQNFVLQEYISKKDADFEIAQDKLRESNHKNVSLEKEIVYLQSRIESTTTAFNAMKETVNSESASKVHMTHLLEVINNRMELFTESSSKDAEKFKDTIEKLNRELQHARYTLTNTEKQLENYKSLDQQEIKEKYNESVIEVRLLKTKITEIEQQLSNVNQERIVAQTKLAAAEEQIKNLSTSDTPDGSTGESNSCSEHVRLLASAEDRIRILEHDIENYHAVITQNEQAVVTLTKEHTDYVANSQGSINNLVKELEAKTAAVAVVQAEAEQNIAQFKVLHEKALSTQSDLMKEKQDLEAKVEGLGTENSNKENEINSLRDLVEEKNVAFAEAETKLATQVKVAEEYRQNVNILRAEVSNLTKEISDYKAKAEASNVTVETLTTQYKREADRWSMFEESLKKTLAESEKQREHLAARLDEFIKNYDEWKAGVENNTEDNQDFAGTEKFVINELREVNKNSSIDKEMTLKLYKSEKDERQRLLAELAPLKSKLVYLETDLDRARKEIQKLTAEGGKENFKLQCEAFKTQNKHLYEENERLIQKQEEVFAELDKKNQELIPMTVQVYSLKQQLDIAKEEITMLRNSEKEWARRSANLLSKYNIKDPAEIDRMTAELEAAKSELEALKTEKSEIEKTVEQMKTEKETFETERGQLAARVRERGRIAIEFRKKATDAETKVADLEKKLSAAEAARVAANSQSASKIVKGKEELDEEKKKIEETLKTKTDECLALEKKYNNILIRARSLQQDRAKNLEELKTLRAAQAEAGELKAQITTLEEELNVARKTLQANSVELTRLKAQNSMALNKSTRMQKELDNLKATKVSTLSAAAPAFQISSAVVESPSATHVNSPVISEVPRSPKVAASEATSSIKVATPEVNTTPKIATPEVNGSPKIVSDVNTSPKIVVSEANTAPKVIVPEVPAALPEVPVTPMVVAAEDDSPPEVAAATPPTVQAKIETPTHETTEAEETNVATPITETDVEIDELVTASPAVDLDVDLIDEEATNAEVSEDIAASNEDVTIKDDSIEENAENAAAENTENTESAQADEEIFEEVELAVETGVKRERAEDEDVPLPESPTKKAHIDE